jgi:hypothetical protein
MLVLDFLNRNTYLTYYSFVTAVYFYFRNHNNISDYNNRLQSMLVNGGKNKYMNEMVCISWLCNLYDYLIALLNYRILDSS